MAVNRLNVGATNQLLAKASTGQSTNILELQNTAGVTVAGVDASGNPVGGLTAPTAAGKNKIINGDFGIWQRGTSFTAATNTEVFTADRWAVNRNGSGTVTVSQQSFTAGTAPVAGYEAQYFLRFDQSVAGSGATFSVLGTKIEDVRTFANQTVTLSFWAKSAAAKTYSATIRQNFGSGGSSAIDTNTVNFTTSTSWQRFSFVVNVPSISGKTIGTSSYLHPWINLGLSETTTFDIWGVQLEAGSIATPFVPAGGGGIGAELALCKRYCQRYDAKENLPGVIALQGWYFDANSLRFPLLFESEMRAAPTLTYNGSANTDYATYSNAVLQTGFTFSSERANARNIVLSATKTSHGFTNNTSAIFGIATTSGFLIFSSEL